MKNLALETGISDHHKLIGPKLRSTFTKEKPSKILYCCYKNFGNEQFEAELKTQILPESDFESFRLAFKLFLNLSSETEYFEK